MEVFGCASVVLPPESLTLEVGDTNAGKGGGVEVLARILTQGGSGLISESDHSGIRDPLTHQCSRNTRTAVMISLSVRLAGRFVIGRTSVGYAPGQDHRQTMWIRLTIWREVVSL